MKNKTIYILFIIMVVYHLLNRTWWTPYLSYTGTYGILIYLLFDKFRTAKKSYKSSTINKSKSYHMNPLLILVYFSFIYIYAMTAVNRDVKAFYEAIHLRTWALGFGGLSLLLLMFIRREK